MPEHKGKENIEKFRQVAHKAANTEVAPAPVWRYRAILFQISLLLITAAFAGLTFLVKTEPSFSLDLKITLAIQSINAPVFGWLMNAISWLGYSPQSMIITVLITLVILGFGLTWESLVGLLAALSSLGLNVLVKDLIQRPRPTAALVHVFANLDTYSFPSGHVMYYTCFYGFMVFLAFTLLKPSLKRTLLLVFCSLLVLLVGVSRIYVGDHWASDVLGAYMLGTLILVAIIQLYRWGKPRFFVVE